MSTDAEYPPEWVGLKLRVKIEQGFRCVRCKHPNARFSQPENDHRLMADAIAMGMGLRPEVVKVYHNDDGSAWLKHCRIDCDELCTHDPDVREWRIITVHHLDGMKENLAWWNLACLCQRCHLTIQAKVKMTQTYQLPHSEWFLPYVGGYYGYASGQALSATREEVEADLVKFLVMGQPHLDDHYRKELP